MRNSRSRFNTGLLHQGDGEFNDTGCHTQEGNNLCLYVNTTKEFFDLKVIAFQNVQAQKKHWQGATEFSVPMRLQKPAEALFDASVKRYGLEMGEPIASCPEMFEDFLLWLCRDFDDYLIEQEIIARNGDAA